MRSPTTIKFITYITSILVGSPLARFRQFTITINNGDREILKTQRPIAIEVLFSFIMSIFLSECEKIMFPGRV